MGRPVPELEKLPAWTIITSIDQVPMQPPQYAPSSVSATRVRRQGQGFCFQVPSAFAAHWCMHLPIALIEAMGWSVTFGAFPPRAVDRLQVSLQPKLAGFVISPETMQGLLRKQSFLGQLYQLAKTQPPGCPKVEVELQCQAETVAFTSLPAAMTVETILNCWRSASLFAGCWPKARVTSGPFPLPVERNLQTNGAQPLFRRKGSSRILLCVHVEHRGGGAKDDGVQLAKTRIASLLLDRGVSLHETTVVTDRLLDKLGASKCLALVKPTDPAQRWEDLAKNAKAAGVEWPSGDSRVAKAAARIQKALRKQRLPAQTVPVAAQFRLCPGIWCGMDEQPVPILQNLCPGATGVILQDAAATTPEDLALLRTMESDALCVAVLGYDCPEPSTCGGTISISAEDVETGRPHLLAGCFHNVGATDVQPKYQTQAAVTVEGMVCCAFTVYRDDLPAEVQWSHFIESPVRTAQQQLQAQGVEKPFVNPWGRTYRADGKPVAPSQADSLQFYAKVPDSILRTVLQQSGFLYGVRCAQSVGGFKTLARVVGCLARRL
ncbi:unnamed protein product [Symbiodinium natans]|uniref:Uncharacterized protein n=1 Tax=Symbiodinium natans TaxID=878477 RepID=A0A812JHB1_9DINO|nr:unnamed protein product [Symbiodinium natans]